MSLPLRVVCAWCNCLLRPGPLPVSHSICRDCFVRLLSTPHPLQPARRPLGRSEPTAVGSSAIDVPAPVDSGTIPRVAEPTPQGPGLVRTPPLLDTAADPGARWLWNRMLQDRPLIGRQPPASFALANAVRDWAFTRTLAAADHLLLDAGGQYDIYLAPASAMLRRMDALEGGFMCGRAAAFLRQVYRALGLTAYAINLGDAATIGTHVVTLVALPGADATIVAVQDPYLNWALVGADGEPVSWPVAARAVRSGHAAGLAAVPGPSTERPVLLGHPLPGSINNGDGFAEELAQGRLLCRPDPGRAVYASSLFTVAAFERGPWFAYHRRHRLQRFGTDSLLSLLGYPLSSSGEDAVERMLADLA